MNKLEIEEIATFKTALALKKDGFEEPTLRAYNLDGIREEFDIVGGYYNNNTPKSNAVSAPSWYQAKKWIEEKYKLYISLEYNFNVEKYRFTANKEKGGLLGTKFIFESEQAALEYAFDMILNPLTVEYFE